MFAVGVKLRQVGPIMFASVPTVLSSCPPSCTGGAGRSVCSCRCSRRDRGVGRGVTFRLECEDVTVGGDPRAARSVPPSMHSLLFGNSVCYPGSPFWGSENACGPWGLLLVPTPLVEVGVWVCFVPMTSGVPACSGGVWFTLTTWAMVDPRDATETRGGRVREPDG